LVMESIGLTVLSPTSINIAHNIRINTVHCY